MSNLQKAISIAVEALHSVTKTPEEEAHFKTLAGEEKISAYLEFVARAKQNPIGRRAKLRFRLPLF